jgi:hypothetical protein
MGTDVHAVWQAKRDDQWYDVASTWEQNRHYFLFAWLAGVRNGYGFAGTPTHTPIVQIAPRRGLPDDFKVVDGAHPTVVEAIDTRRRKYMDADALALEPTVWMGDHSFSWLLGSEILAAKRPTVTERTGIVDIDFYKKWDHETPPEAYCGGISGRDVVLAESTDAVTPQTTHVRIAWTERTDGLDYFVDEVKRLVEQHGDVRLVFGFDS